MLRNQYNTTPKILRSDGGAEFYHSHLTQFLTTHSILHQKSCPYTPQQNGLTERKHRHILDTTRALMFDANLPTHLWDASIITATYLINRLPSPTTFHVSPYQLLHHTSPDYAHLRVFGCACYPFLPPHQRNKLQPRTMQCVFIGYSPDAKGYLYLHPKTRRIYLTRHIIFDKICFPYRTPNSPSLPPLQSANPPTTIPLLLTPASISTPVIPLSIPHPLSTSNISSNHNDSHISPISTTSAMPHPSTSSPSVVPIPPSHHMITRAKIGSLKPRAIFNLTHSTSSLNTPTSLSQALKLADWRTSMSQEFMALQRQGTWDLVPPPASHTILGS